MSDKWDKLNKELDDALNSMTKEDWVEMEKKQSKRVKIKRTEGTPIDMSHWYENQRKREEAENKKRAEEKLAEETRINQIECPVCKSTGKIHYVKRNSNGIMGPGHSSWVTEEYLICKSCGIHYSDVSKFK